MHWKFPTQRDGRPDDKDNCVTLMKVSSFCLSNKHINTETKYMITY